MNLQAKNKFLVLPNEAKNILLEFGFLTWNENLLLVSTKVFDFLPDNLILTSINGNKRLKQDCLETDVRHGTFLAFGVTPEQWESVAITLIEKDISHA